MRMTTHPFRDIFHSQILFQNIRVSWTAAARLLRVPRVAPGTHAWHPVPTRGTRYPRVTPGTHAWHRCCLISLSLSLSLIMARKRKPKTKTANRNGQALTAATEQDPKPTKATTSTSTKLNGSAAATSSSSSSSNFIDDLLPAEPGMKDLSTVRVLLVGAALLSIGTTGFYHLPGMIKGGGDDGSNRLVNAFYCATMTLTT